MPIPVRSSRPSSIFTPAPAPVQAPAPAPAPPGRRSGASSRLWAYALAAALLFTGCPRRFDPRADEIHSQNPEAEADYRKVQQLIQKGELVEANQQLQQFLGKYSAPPADPLVPVATLLAAQVARGLGQPARARDLAVSLAHPPPTAPAPTQWISDRARLELGLAQHRLGDFAEARALLAPLSAQIVPGDEATELHATLADLWLREDQLPEALHELDLFYHGVGVRAAEQAYVREQVGRLLGRLPPDQQSKLRQRFGIESAAPTGAAPDAAGTRPEAGTVVGLAVPLLGKDRALGERVLRGALWAAESLGGPHLPGQLGGVDLRVRDTAGADAATLIDELKREGVQVLIGSPARGGETTELLARAERAGLLTLSLSAAPSAAKGAAPAPAPTSRLTYQLLRSNVARAQALARHLVSSGLPTVAVLAPATPYGQTMTRAFIEALGDKSAAATPGQAPIRVVEQLTFADNATTFTAQAKKLLLAAPAALYVPGSAAQLELIAAQLASSGVLPIYKVTRGTADNPALGSPPVKLLLASAEGLGEGLLTNAGRYLQGAVLAPLSAGKLPVADSGASTRWDGYSEQVGAEPGALDALGYDAVLTLRSACAQIHAHNPTGRCTSEALAGALRGLTVQGATGPITFDDSGQRTGPVLLLRVDGSGLRAITTAPAPTPTTTTTTTTTTTMVPAPVPVRRDATHARAPAKHPARL